MSDYLDELELAVAKLKAEPMYRRGPVAEACFRLLMAELRELGRRVSQLEQSHGREL